ncbi:MAG: bifunctional phosphoribosylaminoimidazolecarboxamide formyltransferase/IMP cyclohydrolase [Acidobacteriota bacterium]
MNDSGRRALVSVYHKEGVVDLCRQLRELGFEIISTGGTARHLSAAGVAVTPVSEITGFPEILDGRVKTLHPLVHGAILFRRDDADHRATAQAHDMRPIDLVAVNLYPFADTVSAPGAGDAEIVEMIDIGGPSMVRAAAKNHAAVTVIVNPDEYTAVIDEMKRHGETTPATRRRLAADAFAHCAAYDATVASYLRPAEDALLPAIFSPHYARVTTLRYGENPHQRAALYRDPLPSAGTLLAADVLQGKQLSYNNYQDLDSAWALSGEFQRPAAVIVKHNNPCGVACGEELASAYIAARETDPVSAFGSIVAVNRVLDGATATEIAATFVEAVIAPEISAEARKILAAKKNLRLLSAGAPPAVGSPGDLAFRRISGGGLLQEIDRDPGDGGWHVVTDRHPDDEERRALDFAWRVVRHVRSNAIVYAVDGRTLGIGAGQMSRVDSARLGVEKACASLQGAVLASDAFFPFRDSIDRAAEAGVKAIIQPGGSIRDAEVVGAANEAGMAMIFTGIRHFRH